MTETVNDRGFTAAQQTRLDELQTILAERGYTLDVDEGYTVWVGDAHAEDCDYDGGWGMAAYVDTAEGAADAVADEVEYAFDTLIEDLAQEISDKADEIGELEDECAELQDRLDLLWEVRRGDNLGRADL